MSFPSKATELIFPFDNEGERSTTIPLQETPIYTQEIIRTDKLDLLLEEIENADEETLFLFDIDNTLIRYLLGTAPLFRPSKFQKVNHFLDELKITHPSFSIENLITYLREVESGVCNSTDLSATLTLFPVIDNKIFEVFKRLQARDLPFIAITAACTGKDEKYADWRIAHMQELGFNFHNTFPETSHIEIKSWEENHLQEGLFKSGILFTNRQSKGPFLKSLWDMLAFQYKKIVFIDNSSTQHKSISEFCKLNNINYKGFLYTAIDTQINYFNKERTLHKIDTFINYRK